MGIKTDLQLKIKRTEDYLRQISESYSPITLANSLGAEDMVLTDMISRNSLNIENFTLDTGRLHEETYGLLARIKTKYDLLITVYYPNGADTEHFVGSKGINAFYDSVESRKSCCQIRKVEPLIRALAEKKAWVTGLRREQSITRDDVKLSAWDAHFKLQKFNPLYDWSEQDTWDYIRHFDVPYNELHDKHYPSIGCAPCTRAIKKGEDIRAGRWWWENPVTKECGLHNDTEEKVEEKISA